MDICIDTDAITEGVDSISQAISNVEQCVWFIKLKVESAGQEFTSVNFERASDSIFSATDALDNMSEKLEMTKTFLNKLISHIERYHSLKF